MNDTTKITYLNNDSILKLQSDYNNSPVGLDVTIVILNVYIGPVICAFGICGNILSLIILLKGNLYESPYIYLKTLAVTDMLALILSFIHMVFSSKSKSYTWQTFNAFAFFPLVNLFMAASVWLTVGVTIDRFIFVKKPLWARSYCSVTKAKFRILFILLFSLLTSIPRFFCYSVEGKNGKFSMKKTFFRSYGLYRIYDVTCIIIFHVVPLLILMICNVYLICAVHRARLIRRVLNIRNNKEKDWQNDQRRFTITLISIVLLSIIAILPSTIGDFTKLLHIPFEKYQKLRHASNMLLLCNLSMNFLLYCAFNKRFVRVMKTMFCGRNCGLKSEMWRSRSTKFSKVEMNAF